MFDQTSVPFIDPLPLEVGRQCRTF